MQTDENLQQEIAEAIKKNLPEQVGSQLKGQLQLLEELKIANEKLSQEKLLLCKSLSAANAIADSHEDLDKRASALKIREEAVTKKERDLKIAELEYKLSSANANTIFAKDVALGLVKNINYRKRIFDDKSRPFIDQYGNQQYSNTTNVYEESSEITSEHVNKTDLSTEE